MFDEIKKILDNLYEGAYIVDKDRKIIYWNRGCEKITGFTEKEVVNSFCYANILRHVDKEGNKLCFNGCPLQRTVETGETLEIDVFLHHKNGHRVPVAVKSMPIYNSKNEVVAAIEVFTDIRFREDKYKENETLKKLIDIDDLTKIYNRKYINFQINQAILEYKEFETQFGILFIDIDHFKNVNDTYGHNAGDEVLKTISKTLVSNLRPHDYAGRWGGEEFVIILKRINIDTLRMIAEKTRVLSGNSFAKYEDSTISVTVSIGATLYRKNESIEELIKRADKLMYNSKKNGRNKVTFE